MRVCLYLCVCVCVRERELIRNENSMTGVQGVAGWHRLSTAMRRSTARLAWRRGGYMYSEEEDICISRAIHAVSLRLKQGASNFSRGRGKRRKGGASSGHRSLAGMYVLQTKYVCQRDVEEAHRSLAGMYVKETDYVCRRDLEKAHRSLAGIERVFSPPKVGLASRRERARERERGRERVCVCERERESV